MASGAGHPNGLSDDDLHELITDPAAPTARAFRAGGNSVAEVGQLVSFVQERCDAVAAHDIELALDAYIERQGGGRLTSLSLDHMLSRVWERLRGRPSAPPPDMYEIPNRLFEEKGRQQTNLLGNPKTIPE